jgi:hypothetical protein
MDKKTISDILIGEGSVLLIGAGIFFLDSLIAAESVGFRKWIFDILSLMREQASRTRNWLHALRRK